MESQPQNPEFRNNPENFHLCKIKIVNLGQCFLTVLNSVRNKQLPTCPSQVEFAGGKLKVSGGCPLDNLKFQKIL